MLIGASWVAIRNVRLGRGDRRTALRFALYLGGILMFLVLRILLRRTWFAIGLVTLLAMIMFNPGRGNPAVYLIGFLLTMSFLWIVLFRFGLLAFIVGGTVNELLGQMPIGPDLASWRGAPTVLTLIILLALAGWGFWISLAGRPLFRDELQEAESRV